MRTRLFWQNHTAIKPIITVFIVLLYSSILSAFDITLSSPSNVELNESFDVSISSENTQKTFDIKIYVHNSPDDKIARNEIISYISDGNVWKDSYLYIINSYPSLQICAQLRENGKTAIFSKTCNSISINSQNEESDDLNEENDKEKENENIEKNSVSEKDIPIYNGDKNNLAINSNQQAIQQEDESIRLSSPNKEYTYVSKDSSRMRIFSIAFTIFAFIVLLLIFFKKV